MTRLLMIGPPGSGKGTQAEWLSAHLGIVSVSTGDIFRMHVLEGSALGAQARMHMDNGDLVPDSVTNRMVQERLRMTDVRGGFLLDGYPRTVAQVAALDAMLACDGQQIDAVLELNLDDEHVVQRLLLREGSRSDDNEEVIRHRLDLYHQQTKPVVAEYAERGLLSTIDGLGPIKTVGERVLDAVAFFYAA